MESLLYAPAQIWDALWSSKLQGIGILLSMVIAWVIWVVVYRLWFHPLARYPGPLFARITDWYNVYHCFIGDRHLEFYRIHQRYGRFVRYGPNRISINSNTALKTIYGSRANVQKSSNFLVFPRIFDNGWSTQTIIDTAKHNHAPKRKVVAYALSENSLAQVESSMLSSINKFCELIKNEKRQDAKRSQETWSAARDVSEYASYLSFDIMGQICFGQSFDTLEKSENRDILHVISDGAQCLNTISHMQRLLDTGIHKLLFRKLLQGLQRYKDYSKAQCNARLRDDPHGHATDVLSNLHQARRSDKDAPLFSKQELVSESSLLIIAGADTTSTCLSATLFYLLHNPHAMSLAQSEVRGSFTTSESIRSGQVLSKCRYLRCCIEESLRMSPPVGGLMAREVLPGGIEVDGHFFTQDTELGVPHYAIHHEESYYPEPFRYMPERWLSKGEHDDKGSQQLALAQSAFCPFSIGPRGCVGKIMAYQEMMTVLARVLWEYDLRLEPGSELGGGDENGVDGRKRKGEYQLYDTFASRCVGPMMEVRPRL